MEKQIEAEEITLDGVEVEVEAEAVAPVVMSSAEDLELALDEALASPSVSLAPALKAALATAAPAKAAPKKAAPKKRAAAPKRSAAAKTEVGAATRRATKGEEKDARAAAKKARAQAVIEEDEAARAAADATAAERARVESLIPVDAMWYVIHTYAGYENKVKQNLEHRIESMGMLDQIFQVVVPVEEEVDIKDGQRRIVERKIFPGYVLVRMILSEDSWGVVRNTPAVTGFVGSGTQPTPLRQPDVDKILRRMEADEPTIRVSFRSGQNVRIVDGPFTDFHGIVDEIDMDRGKVRLMVNFFGRETPVELDFLQVEKV